MVGRQGILHEYAPKLVVFEHTSIPSTSSENLLIFIGGLGDGLLTVPYTTPLSLSLPANWTLVQPILSSSHSGWGTSSLQQDAAELSQLVDYFRQRGKQGRFILMGHSTGCQDVMEYLTGEGHHLRPAVQGVILQASVSDREALAGMNLDAQSALGAANAMITSGNGGEIFSSTYTAPFYGSTPVTANRFYSLTAPGGDDDYFSTDLSDQTLQKSFGSIPVNTGLCILFSGEDEYVAKDVDRDALVERWLQFAGAAGAKVDWVNSGVIKGATHSLTNNPDLVVQDLIARVTGFIKLLTS